MDSVMLKNGNTLILRKKAMNSPVLKTSTMTSVVWTIICHLMIQILG